MITVLDACANVKCSNCYTRFPLLYVRDILWRNKVWSEASKPFWRMGPIYAPPLNASIKCWQCLIELQLRKGRMLLIESFFWIGGCILSIALNYMIWHFAGPEQPVGSLGEQIDQAARSLNRGLGSQPNGHPNVFLMMLLLCLIPPLSFCISRILSYRLVAFDRLPGGNRAPHPGL